MFSLGIRVQLDDHYGVARTLLSNCPLQGTSWHKVVALWLLAILAVVWVLNSRLWIGPDYPD